MFRSRLNKILQKKEISNIIDFLIDSDVSNHISIYDQDETLLFGSGECSGTKHYPIMFNSEIIGWINCADERFHNVISSLIAIEYEKRALATDTLEKYREMSMMYDISTKLATCIDIDQVIQLILDEAQNLIAKSGLSFGRKQYNLTDSEQRVFLSNVSVMLLNEETGKLEVTGGRGREYRKKTIIAPGEGIAGRVFVSGKAEIVNDVDNDPRYYAGENKIFSLMCTPLRTKDKVIGVLNISSQKPVNYLAKDLKLFSVLASLAASPIENSILHQKRIKEEHIKSNLERYIAPQIVQAIINSTEDVLFSPQKKNIALLFADIRKFSTLCEKLQPEQVVTYLNEYFTFMVEIIFKYHGTLNKFVGDMVFAFFGAPSPIEDKEILAVEAAVQMQKRIKSMPTKWISDNFHTGIGISSGEVIVGNIGSPRHTDYTAIGDEVNIAERLESIAKGGQILVTRTVYEAAQSRFEFKKYGDIEVKGRVNKVEIFEVIY
ncbi:MAG: GAF domain-containing protein [Nitrospirae bacterium]|nr:GAF domain-containing protein [Nitrospirota bacterium]MBF0540714.1 GAF domain-containing protein [Nitrospirota bacterium]